MMNAVGYFNLETGHDKPLITNCYYL